MGLARLGAIAGLGLAYACIASASAAAEISSGKAGLCDIRLDGSIGKGDARAFAKELSRRRYHGTTICFSGPGGDFAEAMAIMALMKDAFPRHLDTLGTAVPDGASCLAECALLFMVGRHVEHHSTHLPRRRLGVGARLVFKLPRLPDATAEGGRRALAYRRAVESFAALLRLEAAASYRDDNRTFPRHLLLKLAFAGPEGYRVEELGDAARLRIDLPPYPSPSRLTRAMLRQACENTGVWEVYWSVGPDDGAAPTEAASADEEIAGARHQETFAELGPGRDLACVASAYRVGSGPWSIKVDLLRKGENPTDDSMVSLIDHVGRGITGESGGNHAVAPSWITLPADTPLDAFRGR